MILSMDEMWMDSEAPWWAKLRRAAVHIEDVRAEVATLENDRPWSVESEPGERPNEVAFRLHVRRQVPADLATTAGDAIHNLRSALDTVAYALARRYLGRDLSPDEEQATQFPICRDRSAFDEFFDNHMRRRSMYGEQERHALRCVQPFALSEEATALGLEQTTSAEIELKTDSIYRLHRLSIVDKHRRLPLLSWFPNMHYWSGPPGGASYRWRQAASANAPFEDGTVLGYLSDPDGNAPPQVEVFHEIRLTFMDDPAFRRRITDVLEDWHFTLCNWALPRIFTVASGQKPPILT